MCLLYLVDHTTLVSLDGPSSYSSRFCLRQTAVHSLDHSPPHTDTLQKGVYGATITHHITLLSVNNLVGNLTCVVWWFSVAQFMIMQVLSSHCSERLHARSFQFMPPCNHFTPLHLHSPLHNFLPLSLPCIPAPPLLSGEEEPRGRIIQRFWLRSHEGPGDAAEDSQHGACHLRMPL